MTAALGQLRPGKRALRRRLAVARGIGQAGDGGPTGLRLAPFEPRHAFSISRWAGPGDLPWLAPNTLPPLTAAKVLAWKRAGGEAFVLVAGDDSSARGYGELNAMSSRKTHFWLGHIVVRPDQRGRGVGELLLRLLLARAFEQKAADRVSLIVFPGNKPAIRCYQRVGFAKTGDEFHQFSGSSTTHRLWRMEMDRTTWQERAVGRSFHVAPAPSAPINVTP